jgi:hypothetical protein
LWSNWWNEDWQGKPKYSEKTCPSAILSTTNPTWPDPCANTGRRGGKPATNRLSYGAALYITLTSGMEKCCIMTRLRARRPRNRVSIPGSVSVHTGSAAQPASYPMGTRDSMEIKHPGREADHTPPYSAEAKNGGAILPRPQISSFRRA